jgi:hypothetical protein
MKRNLSDLDQNGYYNQTIHKCILKLHLPLALINKIYKNLYNKNEVSGVFYVDNNDNVIDADTNEGDHGSVYTPNTVINYHTHPINAYREGKTACGWPSGEDFRETLKFALNGNKAHLVFTVEGLYTIQVSPCKIKKIKELLNDTERGILIFLIEEYFKTTHDFRCVDELNNLAEGNININPYSFIDFANTFDIANLLANKKATFKKPKDLLISKTGHTGIHSDKNIKQYSGLDKSFSFSKIPNMGFPSVEDDYIKTTPASSFLKKDDLENLRKIDTNGNEETLNKNNIAELVKKLEEIADQFDTVPCNIEWNSNPNAWFFVNFFPTQHFLNESHKKNGKYVMPKMDTTELFLKNEPFIRIFSNSKTGCKITKIAKTHNFKSGASAATGSAFNMGKRFSMGNAVKRKSTFGKVNEINFINKEIRFLLKA